MPRQRHKPESRAPVWREREKTLAWEGEPVLTYTVKALALPSAPARLERYYRRMEAGRLARWEKVLYPRACAALRDARAVSRAVQRDARRYDGGFTLY